MKSPALTPEQKQKFDRMTEEARLFFEDFKRRQYKKHKKEQYRAAAKKKT